MFDSKKNIKKLENALKSKKNNGQKAIILSAAMATLVASGEGSTSTDPAFADGALTISVAENQSVVVTATAGDALTYAISGDDAALFDIDAASGALTFKADPNFEAAADKGGDNVYNIVVTATGEGDVSVSGNAVITVTNVNEAVSFADATTLAVSVAEGQTAVATVAATDLDGDALTYALSGADAALFDISSAGVVTFKAAPDFETKADAGANGVYNVTVTATDGGGLSDARDVVITVTNENEAVSFADASTLNVNVAENQTAVATVVAADVDGDALTYTLSGADAALFDISSAGVITFKSAANFENAQDVGSDNVYNVTVTAQDAGGLNAARDVAITVTDENEDISFTSGSVFNLTVDENQTTVGTVAAEDLDGDTPEFSLSGGDFALFDISTAGVITFKAAPDFENAQDAGADNIYNFNVVAADGNGLNATKAMTVTMADKAEPDLKLLSGFYENGQEHLVNTDAGGNQSSSRVAQLSNGRYVVVYESDNGADGDSYSVRAQVFNADHSKSGSELIVNLGTAGAQVGPSVSTLSNGKFVVAWTTTIDTEDLSGNAVKMRIFNDDGTVGGAEILVNTNTANGQGGPSIDSFDDGKFVVTWTSYDGLDSADQGTRMQIFSNDGVKIGVEKLVNNFVAGTQNRSEVAVLKNGNIAVTWSTIGDPEDTSGDAIKAKIYDSNGNVVLTEFLVNTEKNSVQRHSDITALANGNFIVTWETFDAVHDTSSYGVKGQIYKADGALVGGEILLNTNITSTQNQVNVASLEGGGFVAVWSTGDATVDGDGYAVVAQVFGVDGHKIGGELTVNSAATDNQWFADVAGLDNGAFVVTWTTYNTADDGAGYAIKAQIFEPDPLHKFISGALNDFNIETYLHLDQTGADFTEVIISDIPDGLTFSVGSAAGDGAISLTMAQLDGLQFNVSVGLTGVFNLKIVAKSDDEGSTAVEVPIHIGKVLAGTSGADDFTNTSDAEFYDGLAVAGSHDNFDLGGNKSDYTFAIVGDDLQITEKADATNVDLLHSVELIDHADGATFTLVADMFTTGDIIGISESDFDYWYVNVYDYAF